MAIAGGTGGLAGWALDRLDRTDLWDSRRADHASVVRPDQR